MLNKIKSYMMPISMGLGILFHAQLGILDFVIPYLLFSMLFISYCKISLKEIRITKLHLLLLAIQLLGSILVYMVLNQINPVLARGSMICILAPTATSAIVVTGMLGGNMVSLASFGLLNNLAIAFIAPIVFVLIGNNSEVSFIESLYIICQKIFFILLFPFLLTIILRKISPSAFTVVSKKQSVSFYLWSIALTVVTARMVNFILEQDSGSYTIELLLAMVSAVICVFQFFVGRKLGSLFGDTIAGGQGFGQKNTVLAIWMAQTYFNPISAIAPGTYVLWQNMVNSYQIWKNRKNSSE